MHKIRIVELGCNQDGCSEGNGKAVEALVESIDGEHCGERYWIWIDSLMTPNNPDIGSCYDAEIFTTLYPTNCGNVIRYLMNQIDCPPLDPAGNIRCINDTDDACSLPPASLDTEQECVAAGCSWLAGTHGCGNTDPWPADECGYDLHNYSCSINSAGPQKWDGAKSDCLDCDCNWCCCPAFDDGATMMPDLVIDYLIIYDYDKNALVNAEDMIFEAGKRYGLYPVIKNIGRLSTKREPLYVQIKVDSSILGRVSTAVSNIGTLGPGESIMTSSSLDYELSSTYFEVGLAVDIDDDVASNTNHVKESNENNNRWTGVFNSSRFTKKTPPCASYGDVDNDGYVTKADSDLTLNYAVGSLKPTAEQKLRADVTADGVVTSADSSMILQYAESPDVIFPVCEKCTDTDGGIDYYRKGDLNWPVQGFNASDTCRGDYVHEYFCKGDMYGESDYLCPGGCAGGACNPSCTDSDGGRNYNVKGIVDTRSRESAGHYYDVCLTGKDTLYEWYCDGARAAQSNYTCPFGCYDGSCINGTSKSDLVLDDIYYDGLYFIKIKYCNIGLASSDSSFLIKLRNDNNATEYQGNYNYRFRVPAPGLCEVTPGYACSLIGVSCGDYINVSATIDWEEMVNESNENNNILTKTIGSPDYVCNDDADCGMDGCTNSDGASIYTLYDCMYPGTSSSKCISFHIETDNDNDRYNAECNDCNDNDPSVNPGATEICTDWIDNDCDGFVDGKDPDCSMPDLTVENIDLYLITDSGGIKVLHRDVTIKNRGDKDTGVFKLQFYLNGLNNGYLMINNLGPGQTFTNERESYDFYIGLNTLQAIVDYDSTVDESDESNNNLTKSITIASGSVRESAVVWNNANSFYGNICEAAVDCPSGYIATSCGFDTQGLDGKTVGPITEMYKWSGKERCGGYFENQGGDCSDFRIQAICLKDAVSVTELWNSANSFYGDVCEATIDCASSYVSGCGFDTQGLDGTSVGLITEFYKRFGSNSCNGYFENQGGDCSDFRIQAICLKDAVSVTELWNNANSFYDNICEATVDCPSGYIALGCGFDTQGLDGKTIGPVTELYKWSGKERCSGYFENAGGDCSNFRIQGICLKA